LFEPTGSAPDSQKRSAFARGSAGAFGHMSIRHAEQSDLPRILAIQKQAYISEARIYEDYSLPPLLQSLDHMIAEFESKTFLKSYAQQAGELRAHCARLAKCDALCSRLRGGYVSEQIRERFPCQLKV
jgi:hypothetical protein